MSGQQPQPSPGGGGGATVHDDGRTVLVLGSWDIKMPPIKKHMVSGHMVPTLIGTATRLFNQKKRRVAIEILAKPATATATVDDHAAAGAADNAVPSMTTTQKAWDLDKHDNNNTLVLNDQDQVVLRFFRHYGDGDDHDDQSISTVGSENNNTSAPGAVDEKTSSSWRVHSKFRSDDIEVLKLHKETVEIKLGSGHETHIRDLHFDSVEHAHQFVHVLEKTNNMEKERTKRQIDKYRSANKQQQQKEKKPAAPARTTKVARTLPLGDDEIVAEEANGRDVSDNAMIDDDDEDEDQPIRLLIEIVSAKDLPIADISSSDAYVVVRMKGKEVHRTSVIPNNLNPIWTMKTGSLFVLEMTPEEFFSASSGMFLVIKDYDAVGSNEIMGYANVTLDELLASTGERTAYDIVSENDAKKKDSNDDFEHSGSGGGVGVVAGAVATAAGAVSNKLVSATTDMTRAVVTKVAAGRSAEKKKTNPPAALPTKKVFDKNPAEKKKQQQPKLFLRIKKATDYDIAFMDDFNNNRNTKNKLGMYSDETFVPIQEHDGGNKILTVSRERKRGPNKEEPVLLRRVHPGPDPERPEDETKWMTGKQIREEAFKPSTNWIEAGSGSVGKLYLEVIGCDGLPNMDASTVNIREKTDAFLNIVYEDCIVNSTVISNCLSPRWMPWTQRAFVFNMSHPSSDAFVGVFDHDPENSPVQRLSTAVSDVHDPIGRIIVKVQKLLPDTTYLLTYPLYYGELEHHRTKTRGTVTLRMRVEFPDMRKTLLRGLKPPPATVVSLARNIDYRVATYTAQGVHDDLKFSLGTLTGYIEELETYQDVIYVLKDAVWTVFFWRGHFRIGLKGRTLYLPLHSLTAYVWAILLTWNWNLLFSFLVFAVGWALLACLEKVNDHPSRWYNSPSYYDMLRRLLVNSTGSETVLANANVAEIEAYEAHANRVVERRKFEKEKEEANELTLQKDLSGEMQGVEEAEEVGIHGGLFSGVNVNPLKPHLYPIQKELRKAVYALRIAKSIVIWNESYYTFWLTTACFLASIVLAFIPFGFILRWTLRVVAWIALGPWMALFDPRRRFKNTNMSDEELDERMRLRFKARYEQVMKSATNFFVRKENAIKMKVMAQVMFGEFLLRVPRFCEDLYEDHPLPASSCAPVNPKTFSSIEVKERKFGQRLHGAMIPEREIPAAPAKAAKSVKAKKGFWMAQPLGKFLHKKDHSSESTPLLDDVPDQKKYG